MRYPESAPEFPASRRSLSDVMPYARRGTFAAAAVALALANPNVQPVAEASENPEVATMELESLETDIDAQENGHDRVPDAESSFVRPLHYDNGEITLEDNGDMIGQVAVETSTYCGLGEWDLNVSLATIGDSGIRFNGHLAPHGGPDPGPEYTEKGHRRLELGENGQATASIYSLPPVAVYDFVLLGESEEYSQVLTDGEYRPSITISSPDFEEICREDIGTAPEFDDQPEANDPLEDEKDPNADFDYPLGGEPVNIPETTTIPDDNIENDAGDEPTEATEAPAEADSAAVETDSQRPELPATGVSGLKLLALAALSSLVIGSTTIRRTPHIKSARR